MDHTAIEAETARLLGVVHRRGWIRPYVETSCVTGVFPWRVCFGAFGRRPRLIQGSSIDDAFAKAQAWLDAGAPGSDAA
jgi:hypothetical protein